MERKVDFILGFHAHQPIGNFEHILEEAYQKSYLPFLLVLEEHPQIKVTLHFSGFLYQWLNEKHPEINEKIKQLVHRGQIEVMTGGYYEPILTAIPERDRISQIIKLSEYIKKQTGYTPKGLWLTERVWEPQLASTLFDAGIKYTVTDNIHFLISGLTEEETWGYYYTEELGKKIAIFPISERLRYYIPFEAPEKTIQFLYQVKEKTINPIVVMADDTEKFGVWPGTHQLCYQEKWLDRFFSLLEENSGWINVTTFSESLASHSPLGRIYLPCASYTEMMEWALPAKAILRYEYVKQKLIENGLYEQAKSFFRGGYWRNFLAKYPEANNVHKKMLYVSDKVAQLEKIKDKGKNIKKLINQAKEALYAGQTNCAYWHGIFGGLYLPHLRSTLYSKLILAETLCERVRNMTKRSSTEVDEFDFDCDGKDELLVSHNLLNLYFKPHYGGSLFELDIKEKQFNLLDTLARRYEAYHEKLKIAAQSATSQKETKSIHDLVLSKEANLDRYLFYDWYNRYSLLDHFFSKETTLDEFYTCSYKELGDFVNQSYSTLARKKKNIINVKMFRKGAILYQENFEPIEVSKNIIIPKKEALFVVDYKIKNLSTRTLDIVFGVEFNCNLLAGNSPDRYYYIKNSKMEDNRLNSKGTVEESNTFGLKDEYLGLDIEFSTDKPATWWRFPIETVNLSEAGFERVYQGSVILPHWRVCIEPQSIWVVSIQLKIIY